MHLHKDTLEKPFLKHEGGDDAHNSGIEIVLRLSARDFLFDCLVEALAELADGVWDCAHFVHELLTDHVDDLQHLVEEKRVLVILLPFLVLFCLFFLSQDRGGRDDGRLQIALVRDYAAALIYHLELILCSYMAVVFLIHLQQVMPSQEVEVNFVHFLLEHVVNTSEGFVLICERLKPNV